MLIAALVMIAMHQSACPAAFSSTSTTISALSNSQALSICVANSVLVHGVNGSLTLVVGSTSSAPRCLVYPNGLSPDLTSSLLQSGHINCWSLYPPSQSISIVNIGKPSTSKIQSALKSFRPQVPVIFVSPNSGLVRGRTLTFSSSAQVESIRSTILNLPVVVRFTPKTYGWRIGSQVSSSPNPSYVIRDPGSLETDLVVGFGIEYEFPGLTSWSRVSPNIFMNAIPLRLQIGDTQPPSKVRQTPRLVLRPCSPGRWGC